MSFVKLSDKELEDKLVDMQKVIDARDEMPHNIGKGSLT